MKHFIIIITYLLTPALCWCQYFYKTYPKERTATFYTIIEHENSVIVSTGKKCELWECSEVTRFDYMGNRIWNTEFINTDVGAATLLLLNDTLYVGGNYNPGQAKSVINRMTFDGEVIDEHIYTDPLNRFEWSLINQLYSDNKVLYFSGGSYKDNGSNGSTGKGLIYSINKSMDLNICYVDSIQDNSTVKDAHVGPDSLLTCFIMENGIVAPRERRRIEKYDKDLNLVWKYQPPDSLLWLGNRVYLYGTVLDDGSIFYTYYTFGNEKSLPSFLLLDTITKNTIWKYDFPNINNTGRYVLKIKQLRNSDILLSGYFSNINLQPMIKDSPWLMRLDKNGNKIWEHTYVEFQPNNLSKPGAFWDAVELDNGDLMACGFVINNNKWDPLLIRTDSDGCIDQAQANCPQVQIIDLMSGEVDVIGESPISIHPNPASNYITISAADLSIYVIYNFTGQMVLSGIIDDEHIDVSSLSSGQYLIKTTNKNGVIKHHKFIKE